ncbi:MAG: S41 family peptidase [Bacteroidota bacterium]
MFNFKMVFALVLTGVSLSMSIGQRTVTFHLDATGIKDNSIVGIRGNTSPLKWDKSLKMRRNTDNYSIEISFDESVSTIEFKYVIEKKKDVQWEYTENRVLNLDDSKDTSLYHTMNYIEVDIDNLEPLSTDQMLKDFALVKRIILDVHPGTYRYRTKEEIENILDELQNTLKSERSIGAFYLTLSKLLAYIQCDHTFVSYYNQNSTIKTVIHRQKDKLPFTFKWVGDAMVVLKDASPEKIKRGTVITKIDGVSVSKIKDSLMDYIRADGANNSSRMAQLEIKGYQFRYDGFDVFYPLLFPSSKSTFELEANYKGENFVLHVPKITRIERSKILKQRFTDHPVSREDLWDFAKLSDGVSYLKMGSSTFFNDSFEWKEYLKNVFKEIRKGKSKNIIIDIRENEGGLDAISEELVKYMLKGSPQSSEFISKSRYLKFPESIKPFISSWGDPWYFDLQDKEYTKDGDYYSFQESENLESHDHKISKKLKADIYLLVSPINTSAMFYLTKFFKEHQLGTLIGQETAGNLNGINGGQILFLELPNSGLTIDFPVIGSFSSTKMENKGISPDILVSASLRDIQNGKDIELETALSIIESRSQ